MDIWHFCWFHVLIQRRFQSPHRSTQSWCFPLLMFHGCYCLFIKSVSIALGQILVLSMQIFHLSQAEKLSDSWFCLFLSSCRSFRCVCGHLIEGPENEENIWMRNASCCVSLWAWLKATSALWGRVTYHFPQICVWAEELCTKSIKSLSQSFF